MREAFVEMIDLIKSISNDIPKTIKDNSSEIGKIDMKVSEMTKQVHELVFAYFKNLRSFNKPQRATMYQEIQKLYAEIEKMTDLKVKLAQKTYETIDASITGMDNLNIKMSHEIETTKKEAALKKEKAESSSGTGRKQSGSVSRKRKSTTLPDSKAAKFAESDAFAEEIQEMPEQLFGPMDMPINPFEPRYCTCKGVSFGKMVGCDNPECEYEWFHYSCVKLTEDPKGTWYCAKCEPLMTKQKKK